MAALSSFHVNAPGTGFRRPSGFRARPILAAAGETLLFLWTVLALAFSVLVMAGFFV